MVNRRVQVVYRALEHDGIIKSIGTLLTSTMASVPMKGGGSKTPNRASHWAVRLLYLENEYLIPLT